MKILYTSRLKLSGATGIYRRLEQSIYSQLHNQAMELSRMLCNQIQSIKRVPSA